MLFRPGFRGGRGYCAASAAVAILLLLGSVLPGSERAATPSAADRNKSLATVRKIFEAEILAAKKPADLSKLAERLAATAEETKGDPAGKFALWQLAMEKASEAGDAKLLGEIIDTIDQNYAIDGQAVKVNAFNSLAAKVAGKPAKELLAAYAELLGQIIQADRFDVALDVNAQLLKLARAAGEAALVKDCTARQPQLERLQQRTAEVEKAQVTLRTAQDDAAANGVVGRYYCLERGNWQRGLPALAKGDNPALKELAVKELAVRDLDKSSDTIPLADGWWKLSDSEKETPQVQLRLHAADLYQRGQANATGLTKVKVESRIAEAKKLSPPVLEVAKISTGSETATEAKTALKGQFLAEGKKAGELRDDNALKMKLVWCPPGDFLMGTEKVAVTLHGFWIGQTSVTEGQWFAAMGTTPWTTKKRTKTGETFPVTYATLAEIESFCQRLTEAETKKKRLPKGWVYSLPTRAQAEYACRAGTTTKYSFGDNPDQLSDYAWWGSRSNEKGSAKAEPFVHPVAMLKPNPWGIYDMHGNVLEWTRDFYNGTGKPRGGVDPLVEQGDFRVARGGAYSSSSLQCDSTATTHYFKVDPATQRREISFRVVLIPESPKAP